MKQRGSQPLIRLIATAVLATAATLPVAVLSPPLALAAPPSCAPGSSQEGDGRVQQTNAGFEQQVHLFRCPTYRWWGRLHFKPNPGFEGSHVLACTLHIAIVDETAGEFPPTDQTADCTTAARTGKSWDMATPGVTAYAISEKHIVASVNIRTYAGYKNTSAYSSRFDWVG